MGPYECHCLCEPEGPPPINFIESHDPVQAPPLSIAHGDHGKFHCAAMRAYGRR
jgi:hypothetical protein